MTIFFMFCAVVGGTILVCQFVLTLIGLGGHEVADGDLDLGDDLSPEGHDAHGHHGSTWLFSVVSIRTLVAATTFFGLGGLFMQSVQARPSMQLAVGLLMGGGAMVGVHKVLQLLHQLSEDGTVKIQRAVGLNGTVYVPIPANKSGSGKVHLTVQNRLMEYPAVTASAEKLATGAPIVVVDIIGGDTLEVAPAEKPVERSAA